VLSPAAQRRHRLRVVSLDQPRRMHTPEGEVRIPLSEVLADKRSEPPLEACRKDLDYPTILRRQRASRKARCVFAWLAQTHGTGRQIELARELGVSPPRIVQLKRQLARCLAAEDYGPPPTRIAHHPLPKRGRPGLGWPGCRRACGGGSRPGLLGTGCGRRAERRRPQ
jgi:hypothetical protein